MKVFKQQDKMDCGPACLKMISNHYGNDISFSHIKDICAYTKSGVSLSEISDAAERIGFRTLGVKVSYDKLKTDAPFPFIAYWKQSHFIVVYKMSGKSVSVADPAFGLVKYSKSDFLANWATNPGEQDKQDEGIVLLLEPTPVFYSYDDGDQFKSKKTIGFKFLSQYLTPYKKLGLQLILGLIVGSLLQLLFPFLTQSVIDVGISRNDIPFIYLVLAAQLMLFVSRTVVDFTRSWILLYIGQRINISLVSDFLAKLMKMPIAYFDTKQLSDIMQRIGDHSRIENFLTASSLNVLFSIINILIFGVILLIYNKLIFLIFIGSSVLYFTWVILFLKKRRSLDFKRFERLKQNQDSIYQIVNGMQEIKLHNCERNKRWEWERLQAKLFKISIENLKLNQYQHIGAGFINELKNILITVLAAYSVIEGSMTLGMMLSVQYIIGQLNSPIDQLIGFLQSAQDAKISLERISDIHNSPDESTNENELVKNFDFKESISFDNASFQYPGAGGKNVLENISIDIPFGKTTAIVGVSGSGKTTLLKLILGIYKPNDGKIKIGSLELEKIYNRDWRENCGVVMQDGFIFSDSIENNIALGQDKIDYERLEYAVKISCIDKFIKSLPLGFKTAIGNNGQGVSAGQKQRILIARAVYKNPSILLFDEATNALDANNEKDILDNLNSFFNGKTVVVVAHRLSTVKSADQIIVLDNGGVIECGKHDDLVNAKGMYYTLVKNQLELGK